MEEEAEKLKMLQSEVEKQINSPQGVGKMIQCLISGVFVITEMNHSIHQNIDVALSCKVCLIKLSISKLF